MDISVTFHRSKGERRTPSGKSRANSNWKDSEILNPYPVLVNHKRHVNLIYREAVGGFEKKGQPRFHPDYFE